MSRDVKPDSLTQENKDKAERTIGILGTVVAIVGGIISLIPTNDKK